LLFERLKDRLRKLVRQAGLLDDTIDARLTGPLFVDGAAEAAQTYDRRA
jgi:hypothetical protein